MVAEIPVPGGMQVRGSRICRDPGKSGSSKSSGQFKFLAMWSRADDGTSLSLFPRLRNRRHQQSHEANEKAQQCLAHHEHLISSGTPPADGSSPDSVESGTPGSPSVPRPCPRSVTPHIMFWHLLNV